MGERWVAVCGYEGLYEVSDRGRVRSVDRVVPHRRFGQVKRKGRIRKFSTTTYGYLQLVLSKCGVHENCMVHSLVAEAFLGERPDGMVVLHGPGGKTDNRLVNLSYGSPSQNQLDRVRDGTASRGARNPRTRLDQGQVLEIRRLVARRGSKSISCLARELRIPRSTIYSVLPGGRCWAWLEEA
jgi:hypothetical protein